MPLSSLGPIVSEAGPTADQPEGDRTKRGEGEEGSEGAGLGERRCCCGRDAAAGEHRAGEEGDYGGPRLGEDLGCPGLKRRVHEGETAGDEDSRERGARKVAVYGAGRVPGGQERTADQDQVVSADPVGGLLHDSGPAERGEPVEAHRQPGDRGPVPFGFEGGGQIGQETKDNTTLHEREYHDEDCPGVPQDETDPRQKACFSAFLGRLWQPAGQAQAEDTRSDRRGSKGESPEAKVRRKARCSGGDSGCDRARRQLTRFRRTASKLPETYLALVGEISTHTISPIYSHIIPHFHREPQESSRKNSRR